MEVVTRTDGDTVVVSVTGELDGKTAPEAQQKILPEIPQAGRVILDLHGVAYMSSAGLRMMLLLYRHALGKDSKIALVGLAEDIRDTMSATGFLSFFVVSDTVDSGMALLRAPA